MEIYVEELPKNCDSCDIYKSYLGCCLTEFSRTTPKTERHNNCPLRSLAEHDKQVRKEVCEKIKNEARNLGGIRNGEKLFINLDNIVNLINEVIGEKNVSCSF